MQISKEELIDLSRLCRIRLSEDQIEKLHQQINKIIEYFNQIQELDLSNVEKAEHISINQAEVRFDRVKDDDFDKEIIEKNIPEKMDGNYKVPRIIKKNGEE